MAPPVLTPLAERLRPRTLDEIIGQRHLLGKDGVLRRLLDRGYLPSMILWGPPGCGKTTLARLMATMLDARFVFFSAVLSGVRDVRAVVEEARTHRERGEATVLFVDEIHRFNKGQQDAFLPHVENGLVTLVGATTENPSFSIVAPLLSRCRVFVLEPLAEDEIATLIDRALHDRERGLGGLGMEIEPAALAYLTRLADGDGRRALASLELAAELAAASATKTIGLATVEEALQRHALRYDRAGEEHYNLISALHKSLRDSDPDGALYWLCRMLAAGEDPLYIARRLVRFASEDVGNADPQALGIALHATEAFRLLGTPEGELALAQAAIYLATAPKSNACYVAYGKARETIDKTGSLPVPMQIRNAPTGLMRRLGYGRGYQYAHDDPDGLVLQEHLPEKLAGSRFYEPTRRGYEAVVSDRLGKWRAILRQRAMQARADASETPPGKRR